MWLVVHIHADLIEHGGLLAQVGVPVRLAVELAHRREGGLPAYGCVSLEKGPGGVQEPGLEVDRVDVVPRAFRGASGLEFPVQVVPHARDETELAEEPNLVLQGEGKGLGRIVSPRVPEVGLDAYVIPLVTNPGPQVAPPAQVPVRDSRSSRAGSCRGSRWLCRRKRSPRSSCPCRWRSCCRSCRRRSAP